MKVLAYLRASSARQEKAETIELQREAVRDYCKARNWEFELFEDDGVEGAVLLQNRKGGPKLLQALANGQGERVLVFKASRLGRGAESYVTAITQIERYKPIESIGEGATLSLKEPGKIVMTMLYGGMAVEEKIGINRQTKKGSWIKARDAYHWMGGPAPYGYFVEGSQRTSKLVKFDRPTTGNRRLKSEVEVVRHMYAMVADGASCRKVSDYLNDLGIPPQKRKQSPATRWTPGRVRNIIVNPLYMGVHYYGRREVYRKEGDPKFKAHLRWAAKEHWLKRPVPKLAIVDEKLWDRAIVAMKLNHSASKSGVQHEYLLSGLVHCACKRTYTASTAHGVDIWYRCPGRRGEAYGPDGQKCDAAALKGADLEKAVWERVEGLLLKPGATLRALEQQMIAEDGPNYSVADAIRDRETDKTKAIERRKELARQQARNPLPDSDYDELLREANDDVEHIQTNINGLRTQEADANTRMAAMETARGVLQELRAKALDGRLTFEQRRQIVRAVVAGIHVNSDGIIIRCSFEPSHERYGRLPNDDTVMR